MKHTGKRDVPHPRVKTVEHFADTARARKRSKLEYTTNSRRDYERQSRQRIAGEGGGTIPGATGVIPKRPPFCLVMEDLAPPTEQPTGVYGMYPSAFIGKILPWLRCERRQVLHVCSGGLPRGEGIRVDLRPAALPDVVADGRALPFADGSVVAVLLDPPYTEHYARELYGVEYPRPAHLLAEAARVVRPGGRIGFVHYLVPNPPPDCHFVKTFGLSMGFGYPMRAVTIYERAQESLPGIARARAEGG